MNNLISENEPIIYFFRCLKIALVSLVFVFTTIQIKAQSQSQSKNKIIISVHIKGLNDGEYYYLNNTGAAGADSCKAKNGVLKFRYTGEPDGFVIASTKDVGGDGKIFCTPIFWTDSKNMELKGSIDSLNALSITGSDINIKLNELKKIISPLKSKKDDFIIENKLTEADSIKNLITNVYIKQVKSNLNSYYGLISLYYLAISKSINTTDLNQLLNMFNGKLSSSKYTVAIKQWIKNSTTIKVGNMAPDFTQLSSDNHKVSLADFRGKYVLLEFWSSWCGPCRDENPNLVKTYEKFAKKGFEIIGISADVNRETWYHAIKEDNLSWTQLSDLKGQWNEVAVLYNISAIPTNFLLNPKGEIIATNLRGSALTDELNKIFDK
jgi:peroxiredoxin